MKRTIKCTFEKNKYKINNKYNKSKIEKMFIYIYVWKYKVRHLDAGFGGKL